MVKDHDFLGTNFSHDLERRAAELAAAGFTDRSGAFIAAARICATDGYNKMLEATVAQAAQWGNAPAGVLAREVHDWAHNSLGRRARRDVNRHVEARTVTETDAWGEKKVVGGFGDVGPVGRHDQHD